MLQTVIEVGYQLRDFGPKMTSGLVGSGPFVQIAQVAPCEEPNGKVADGIGQIARGEEIGLCGGQDVLSETNLGTEQ
ncbi:MAG: hypothetical protein ACE5LU_24160 [Anaerolineae bacterium]